MTYSGEEAVLGVLCGELSLVLLVYFSEHSRATDPAPYSSLAPGFNHMGHG